MPLVPAVTELVIAETLYLQWMDPKQPIYLYINATGTTCDDGETVGLETGGFAIYDAIMQLKNEAYMGIHHPRDLHEADLTRRRLIFDEFFYLQLGRLFQILEALGTWIEKEELLDKYKQYGLNAVCMEEWSDFTKMLLKSLPYSLTPSQLNAVSEIIWDLKRPVPMNRLLQGDIGCEKTVVAFLTCMEVIGSGFQAAFMVPTELLAIQHYEHLVFLLENIGGDRSKPFVALLTGSISAKQLWIILKGLQIGDIAIVIGTHR